MSEQFYTPAEIADRLKVSEQTVRLWIRDKKIKARKFGRAWRVAGDEYQRIITEGIEEDSETESDIVTPVQVPGWTPSLVPALG